MTATPKTKQVSRATALRDLARERRAEIDAEIEATTTAADAPRLHAASARREASVLLARARELDEEAERVDVAALALMEEAEAIDRLLGIEQPRILKPDELEDEHPEGRDDELVDTSPGAHVRANATDEDSINEAALALLSPTAYMQAHDVAQRLLQHHPTWASWTNHRRLTKHVDRLLKNRARVGTVLAVTSSRGVAYKAVRFAGGVRG